MSGGIDDGYSESVIYCTCGGLPRYFIKRGNEWICENCGKPYKSKNEPREIKKENQK